MSNAIVIQSFVFKKEKRSKINLATQKQEVSMIRRSMLDAVTAKQRMSIPFSYTWLKFKTGFFGLTLKRGVIA